MYISNLYNCRKFTLQWLYLLSAVVLFVLALAFTPSAQAKLFARGGGESLTFTKITPTRVINTQPQFITLYGKFTNKQSKNRRVVIQPGSPPTPFPVRVKSWSKTQITIIIPKAVQAGYYKIFIQKSSRKHGRTEWSDVTLKHTFLVIAKQTKLKKTHQDSICSGKEIRINFSGGPFKNGNRALAMKAEAKTASTTSSRTSRPTVKVVSDSSLELSVKRCFVLKKGAAVRIIYPDNKKSDWISVEERVRH